ncbi:MAG TPA: ATP-dependent metallopeptidase FtsH/Yme1/Tma family protein, partial [Tepidiformaceae bacterium]|nr:ATP-dependent metallopeptidase FtsH/Yme1/Tma family protein [Tepidiformaceae bacterium]
MYSRWLRNSFIYLLILVAVIAIVFAFFNSGADHPKVAFGQVLEDAKTGMIQKIEVNGRDLTVTYAKEDTNGKPEIKTAKIGPNTDVEQVLTDKGIALSRSSATAANPAAVDLEYKDSSGFGPWLGLLLNV